MDIGLSRKEVACLLYDTLDANGMSDGVHVRLMVTRGVRSTPYQDPRVVVGGPTIVIIPEYKVPDPAVYERGLKLFTVHVRRGDPAVQDQKINSHSKLNCILASIQATQAGADEALMLDPHGFVATCNSTHFFIVRNGEVWTSSGKYCLGGITRGFALEVAREAGMGSRINTIMQTCFFAISGVLPREDAIKQIKKAIQKTYGKRGETVVAKNFAAVDAALAHLEKVELPASASSSFDLIPSISDKAPEFVRNVLGQIAAGHGDLLPVSAIPAGGTFPTGRCASRQIAS